MWKFGMFELSFKFSLYDPIALQFSCRATWHPTTTTQDMCQLWLVLVQPLMQFQVVPVGMIQFSFYHSTLLSTHAMMIPDELIKIIFRVWNVTILQYVSFILREKSRRFSRRFRRPICFRWSVVALLPSTKTSQLGSFVVLVAEKNSENQLKIAHISEFAGGMFRISSKWCEI